VDFHVELTVDLKIRRWECLTVASPKALICLPLWGGISELCQSCGATRALFLQSGLPLEVHGQRDGEICLLECSIVT
jgi:hypothetical protein